VKAEKELENRFLDLVEKHQAIIHKICILYSGQWFSRDDLSQEIILQLWKSYPNFRNESAFSTWMYRVALNTAISLTKRRQSFLFFNEDFESYEFEDDCADRTEDFILLNKSIRQLNKIDRAIILLWLEEKKYEEIADIMGITLKNVSVRIHRIKNKLEKIIRKYHQNGNI